MSIFSSLDGSASYVSVAKKLCAAKLDENVLKQDGALSMRLDITQYHLPDNTKDRTR